MQDKIVEQLIAEYLESETSEKRKKEITDELQKINFDISELYELEKINSSLEDIYIPSPTDKLDSEFFKMLEAEKEKTSKSQKNLIDYLTELLVEKRWGQKFAYSLSLIIIGWFLGTQFSPGSNNTDKLDSLNFQVKNMKEIMMISMLNQSSPMERIKAVNFVNELNTVDTKVVSALLHTLNHDENVNVRLVTVESLSRFVNVPEVRAGLIMSISNQDSPIIQLALADLMVKIKEKSSVEQFNKLLAKKNLRYSVREKIESSIKLL